MNRRHIGGDFDDFLKDEGIFEEVTAAALKKKVALQLADRMDALGLSKSELARRMETSRTEINRLLDPDNSAMTLHSLCHAATALRTGLRLELVPSRARTLRSGKKKYVRRSAVKKSRRRPGARIRRWKARRRGRRARVA